MDFKKILFAQILILGVSFCLLFAGVLQTGSQTHETTARQNIFESEVAPKLKKFPNTYSLKPKNGFSFVPTAQASGEYLSANAYIAVDLDSGEILLEGNREARVSIASLTKIMTSVVVLDLVTPDSKFVVSENAASQIPTKIGVVAGEEMELSELLHAALLTSANDAVEVIKEGVDVKYGEEVFIKAMNEKAKFIGLENTSFDNPQGFDGQENYSTASDLAILSHYALTHYPLITEIVKKDYEFISANSYHKQFDLYNWNGLIGVYPNTSGIKIGSTGRAGKTTVVVSERDGKQVLAVLLGAPGILERDLWAAALLDDGFVKLGLDPVGVTEEDLYTKYATWQYF